MFRIPSKERVFGLDLLRFVAIVLVLAAHSGRYLPSLESALPQYGFGVLGVELFFVLSGFLIGGILMRTFSSDRLTWTEVLRFWRRRWWRTLPNYFLVLFGLLALSFVVQWDSWQISLGEFWKYPFFLQNLNNGKLGFFPVSWSLSIEEWFYLTVPLLFFLAFRFGSNRFSPRQMVLFVALAVLVLEPALRLIKLELGSPPWDDGLRKAAAFRLDAIMMGLIAAWVKHYHPGRFKAQKKALALVGLASILALSVLRFRYLDNSDPSPFFATTYFTLLSLAFACLLPWADSDFGAFACSLVARFVTWVAILSYGIYLLHNNIVYLVVDTLHMLTGQDSLRYGLVGTFLYLSFSLLAAYMLFVLYERPMTTMRDQQFTGSAAQNLRTFLSSYKKGLRG